MQLTSLTCGTFLSKRVHHLCISEYQTESLVCCTVFWKQYDLPWRACRSSVCSSGKQVHNLLKKVQNPFRAMARWFKTESFYVCCMYAVSLSMSDTYHGIFPSTWVEHLIDTCAYQCLLGNEVFTFNPMFFKKRSAYVARILLVDKKLQSVSKTTSKKENCSLSRNATFVLVDTAFCDRNWKSETHTAYYIGVLAPKPTFLYFVVCLIVFFDIFGMHFS